VRNKRQQTGCSASFRVYHFAKYLVTEVIASVCAIIIGAIVISPIGSIVIQTIGIGILALHIVSVSAATTSMPTPAAQEPTRDTSRHAPSASHDTSTANPSSDSAVSPATGFSGLNGNHT
jgi:hypothetical protein